jgi:hypothetical protein
MSNRTAAWRSRSGLAVEGEGVASIGGTDYKLP